MKTVMAKGLITIAIFFGIWYLLMQVDWVKLFKTEKAVATTEEKLGDLFWEIIQRTEKEYEDTFTMHAVDSIVIRICKANGIDRTSIQLHLIEKEEVNAFAMPGRHLVIYTGLIAETKNPEEVAGVIGHEVAHLQQNHVMLKMTREIGFATLVSMTTGGAGSELAKEAIKTLSSTAFDRDMEREADKIAVDYLKEAEIDPCPFADLLYRMSAGDDELSRYAAWISTHPDSKERAELVVGYAGDFGDSKKSCLSTSTWSTMKQKLSL